MTDLRIRETQHDPEFAEWFADLLHAEHERADGAPGSPDSIDERYLVLSSAVGDWIGGVRYHLRGGVAHLLEVGIAPEERHHGHAHRLLAAFEASAEERGAHLAEFWTDDTESLALLAALGWGRVLERADYIDHRTWWLLEKRLAAPA